MIVHLVDGRVKGFAHAAVTLKKSETDLEETQWNLFLVNDVSLSEHRHRARNYGFPFLMITGFSHRIV
jgi:hypothetical protein